MVRVDIVFDRYTSQLQILRGRVLRAFLELGIEPHWHEWDLRQDDLPEAIAAQSSFAVLIDGVNVLNLENSNFIDRLYRFIGFFDGGVEDLPSTALITQVMKTRIQVQGKESFNRPRMNHWLPLTVLPIILVTLFIEQICSVCGLHVRGIPFAASISDFKHLLGFLMPVVLFGVFFAVSGYVYRAKERQGYKPFYFACLGLFLLLHSRFVADSAWMFWCAVAVLIFTAIWNAWLKVHQPLPGCPNCPEMISNVDTINDWRKARYSSCDVSAAEVAVQRIVQ